MLITISLILDQEILVKNKKYWPQFLWSRIKEIQMYCINWILGEPNSIWITYQSLWTGFLWSWIKECQIEFGMNHWLNGWIFYIRTWCNWWVVKYIIVQHHIAIKFVLYIWWCIMMQSTIHRLHRVLICTIHLCNQWIYHHQLHVPLPRVFCCVWWKYWQELFSLR